MFHSKHLVIVVKEASPAAEEAALPSERREVVVVHLRRLEHVIVVFFSCGSTTVCRICTTTMQQIDVELNKDNRLAFTDADEEWSSYPAALKALTLSCLYFSSWMPTLPRQDMAETQKT